MSDQAEKKKTDLLGRIDQFRADWEALLEEVGEARFERPGTAGDWTFRDVVAHLNGWRERTLLRLEATHEGRDPAPPPWPSHLDDDTDDEVAGLVHARSVSVARSARDRGRGNWLTQPFLRGARPGHPGLAGGIPLGEGRHHRLGQAAVHMKSR